MNRVLKNEMLSSKHFPERSHNRSKERSAERFPERLHNRSRERSLVIYGGSDLVEVYLGLPSSVQGIPSFYVLTIHYPLATP